MKNLVFKLSFFAFFACFLNSNAQVIPHCNYKVINGTDCFVDVTVIFLDSNGSPCQSYQQTLNPYSTNYFNCQGNCTGGISNVKVQPNWVDTSGNTVTGGAVDYTSDDNIGTYGTACQGSTDLHLVWGQGETSIGH